MGRFSCFYGHLENHKQKKSVPPSFGRMVKMLQSGPQDHRFTDSTSPSGVHEISRKGNYTNCSVNDTDVIVSSHGWRSGKINSECGAESEIDSVHFEMGNLRRSLSVGCDLDDKRRCGDQTCDCVDLVFSSEGSHDGIETADMSAPNVAKSQGTMSPNLDGVAPQSLSPVCSFDLVNHESTFSILDPNYLEKEGRVDYQVSLNPECADGSDEQAPHIYESRISKSSSMPNIGSASPTSTELIRHTLAPRSRSFEDLHVLGIKKADVSAGDINAVGISGMNKDDSINCSEKFDVKDAALDNFDSLNYVCPSKDWIVPVADEMDIMNHDQGNSSFNYWDQVPDNYKRINDWVVDLQHYSPVEETNELNNPSDEVEYVTAVSDGFNRVETKTDTGMEAAKRYISSLSTTATTVQLANLGLVSIPLLGASVSLKALNLSGNSIVRITAGSLPRGLHMLNLSKNKLSTIEGLRELTRLRVLDLSYNKISRIGHGLASCSSVKELYLAGNKISEVEGLHRLLKLAVLDLRFNKIATAKSLGQLAANYNSLQAISLEGNPAHKNVGDEQLKRFLQGLLPQLAYYNRQHIKTSTLKDSSDRSVRLGISGHQFDRGVRSDHKSSSRRSVPKRSSNSSTHGHKGQSSELLKQSRGRHGLVPSGSRAGHNHNQLEIGHNLRRLRSGFSLHKSRSEGTLAQL